jgi:hypothetical protein
VGPGLALVLSTSPPNMGQSCGGKPWAAAATVTLAPSTASGQLDPVLTRIQTRPNQLSQKGEVIGKAVCVDFSASVRFGAFVSRASAASLGPIDVIA